MKEIGMVGICNHCKLRIPIYDTGTALVAASHGMFEITPGEGNITCPGSDTEDFYIVNKNLGIKED